MCLNWEWNFKMLKEKDASYLCLIFWFLPFWWLFDQQIDDLPAGHNDLTARRTQWEATVCV